MVASRRETARRIVIVYVLVGFVFLVLYHFILRPANPDNPLVNALFYVFLPAILILSAGLLEIVFEGLRWIVDRFREKDEEIHNEDAWS
ncbi:MAG: hypothetical protein ACXAB0_16275 [Candidatus Thorarchaeota archaeon]|jgi:hypothetical protein